MESSDKAKTSEPQLPRLNLLKKCIAETSFAADYSKIQRSRHTQALITALDDDEDSDDEHAYVSFSRMDFNFSAKSPRRRLWKHSPTGNKVSGKNFITGKYFWTEGDFCPSASTVVPML
jgi:hypothetical protein